MSVELRHVRCFLSVARHLHFARAAEELGIAPPALTRQIQEAERLLGVRLFHRTKRSVALTAAGEAYLGDAVGALDHLARGAERAALAERGELGKIVIGYVGSAVYSGVLQATVRGFRARYPLVEIGIEEIVMREAGALLMEGRVDIAYVRPPVPYPEGVEARTVHRDAFIVALPADSPLAASRVITPAQLRDQSFVAPRAGIRHARSGAARALQGAGRRAAGHARGRARACIAGRRCRRRAALARAVRDGSGRGVSGDRGESGAL